MDMKENMCCVMKNTIKTPAGKTAEIANLASWPTRNGFNVRIGDKTHFVSDEKIFKGKGWATVDHTKYEVSDGGKVRVKG